jgi:hypothetical protein
MILDTSAVAALFTKAPAFEALCVGGDFRRTDLPLA